MKRMIAALKEPYVQNPLRWWEIAAMVFILIFIAVEWTLVFKDVMP